MNELKYILDFAKIHKEDLALVGGKGANLGEMANAGFPVPPGFVITSGAYYKFLEESGVSQSIKSHLTQLKLQDPSSFQRVSEKIQKLLVQADVPGDIVKEIFIAYEGLGSLFSQRPVAIRSSATAEDLPGASFAGQQETFLNIIGEANLIQKVRSCWASLFTPRALFYRQSKGFGHFKVGIAVVVQEMIQARSSGVMFTVNPVNNDKMVLTIEAIWGLGELIVQGVQTPDHYEVDKKTGQIIKKIISKQTRQLVKKGNKTELSKVPKHLVFKQKISDKTILELATLGKKIHQHYFFPQDIEWAISGNKIYLVQTRPVTTIKSSASAKASADKQKLDSEKTTNLPLIIKGEPASPGIASGYVRIIHSAKEINKVKQGEILLTEMTTPDFVPAMRKAAGIVTDKGGQTSHAAIVSREMGLPCIVGTGKATRVIRAGEVITINGSTGEIFAGAIKKKSLHQIGPPASIAASPEVNIQQNIRTATKLYVNLAEPHLAGQVAKKNVDGVGLLRAEFMIAQIGIHPKKLIAQGRKEVFIDKLTQDLAIFCSEFSPRPVVYRATDFKTSEYANLTGGHIYEPKEANPLLGYRGAFRYIADERVFSLELEAIKKVRHKLNLKNLWLMIPFVRTVAEMLEVKKIVASCGLVRSPSFKLWMMVEIPSNVILLEEFIKVGIDGVSIGSNDLTMLILGLDRDNETVSASFNEQDPAMLWALEKIITTCSKNKITSSICGQAPSRYPELVEKLVSWGITSISVSPDMIETSRKIIYEAESKSVKKRHG